MFLTNLALPEFCSSSTLLVNPIVTTDVIVERDTLCCNQMAPSQWPIKGTHPQTEAFTVLSCRVLNASRLGYTFQYKIVVYYYKMPAKWQ